ncbi:hypothetical protein [Nocardia caishijiensis]|nr:hypothetical protein [Nocardia caishijiensis]
MLTIADFNTREFYVKYETLAEMTGLSVATVKRHVKANCTAGWLKITRQGRTGRANEYILEIPQSVTHDTLEPESVISDTLRVSPVIPQSVTGDTPTTLSNPPRVTTPSIYTEGAIEDPEEVGKLPEVEETSGGTNSVGDTEGVPEVVEQWEPMPPPNLEVGSYVDEIRRKPEPAWNPPMLNDTTTVVVDSDPNDPFASLEPMTFSVSE